MALPLPTSPCWQKLANGGLATLRTDNIATQMLSKRMERSSAPVSQKAAEIHEYYAKWERSLAHEIAQFS
ncbi:MAG: hypothetical protein V4472_11030 [Pseudomonadota bacterium]